MIKIDKKLQNGKLTVQVSGRLDTMTSPLLEAELKRSVTDEVTELIFDLKELEYMSSAGIRVLMAADKVMHAQGEMRLIHLNEDIMEILDITGLLDVLTVEEG